MPPLETMMETPMPGISKSRTGTVVILDSITKLTASHSGNAVIAGSHGGLYPAYLAGNGGIRGVIFSDAGIGLEEAGIAGLRFLETIGLAAATVDYRTARIGDGADLARRGIISHVNGPAAIFGCCAGETAISCAGKMRAAPVLLPKQSITAEGRKLLRGSAPQIWAVDSNSLVKPSDAGAIVVSGSHGALLGGAPASAIGPQLLAVAFNDAGIGIDDAGISRLPALDMRHIAAVTVSAASARIGDACSSWETGILSACNQMARRHGAQEGMKLSAFLPQLTQSNTIDSNDPAVF